MIEVDKIYYINLDYRDDRRNTIERMLFDKGYSNIERIPAIKSEFNYGPPGDGRLAAMQSHLLCLNTAYKAGYKNVMIMEDDCIFHDEYYDKYDFRCINDLINNDDVGYEILYIGFFLAADTILKSFNSGIDKIVKTSFECGLECYVVNVNRLMKRLCKVYDVEDMNIICERLIELHDKKFVHKTHITNEANYNDTLVERYCTNPILAYQSSGYSDIEKFDVERGLGNINYYDTDFKNYCKNNLLESSTH